MHTSPDLTRLLRATLPLADHLFDCTNVTPSMAEDAVRLAKRIGANIDACTPTMAADLFGMLAYGMAEFSRDQQDAVTEGLFLASMLADTIPA